MSHELKDRNNQILRWYFEDDLSTYEISKRLGGSPRQPQIFSIIKRKKDEYFEEKRKEK